ncbi:hypothetical protein LZP73_12130 [Shewanella sp. AS16]|uniref:hypothetical protein n=1 Tax=Shewanella sp. AS16 TaxID=2907625 RepID=UPI001F16A92E|nr:hypothetical protein [Shewanella sp. AS16]MCE9686941.1 hypothetical protein [Shewanella sp. AS16]
MVTNQAIECRLTQVRDTTEVQFRLSNGGQDTWRLLSWHTPFDAWFSEFMHISREGRALRYLGALAKRGAPVAEDYLLLPPGASLVTDLDLSQAYRLESGSYKVELEPIVLSSYTGDSHAATRQLSLACEPLLLRLPEPDDR